MLINQVTEDSHVQAMLTLTAERRELLLCRQHIESLKGALEEGRKLNEEQAAAIKAMEEQDRGLESHISELEAEQQEALNATTEAENNALREKARFDELLNEILVLSQVPEIDLPERVANLIAEYSDPETESEESGGEGGFSKEMTEAISDSIVQGAEYAKELREKQEADGQ